MLIESSHDVRPVWLVLHGSAQMYGSDKVLLNVASALAHDPEFKPVVVLHEDGPLRAALVRAGVEVHVAAVVKIRRAMFGPALPWVLWRELRRAARDLDRITAGRRVALVYSNTLAVLGGAFWAHWRGLRHLWHVHEILLRPAVVSLGLPRLVSALSQCVISNSRQTQAWLLSQAPQLAGRAEVVFNGLPPLPAAQPEAEDAFRSSLGVPTEALLATVAGRLNHWKGQDLLIDALAELVRRGEAAALHLAVVGDVFDGHEDIRARLLAQVERLGLQSRVHFVPFVQDIWPIWRASDIAVVPSTEPEPFGMVAIEAMACSVPVVAAAHGGLLDIVEHERSGLLFAPRDVEALANAIGRLACDQALRARLGQGGAKRQARDFSLATQVAHTRRLCLATMGAT